MKKKYYVMKNKNMAIAISFILGRDFYIFDDRENKLVKCYSFLDDDKFREVLTLVSNKRNEYKNEQV